MVRNVNDIIKSLPATRRRKIEARAATLIAELPDREPVVLAGISAP